MEAVRDALLPLDVVRALYDANAAHRMVAVCAVVAGEEAAAALDAILAVPGVIEAESETVLQTVKYDATNVPIATVGRPMSDRPGEA